MNNKEIKLNDKLSFYPELASILNNNLDDNTYNLLKDNIKNFIKDKKYKYFYNNHFHSLGIAPTGFCVGRCGSKCSKDGKPLCYAKDFYKETEYLSVERCKNAIEKYDVKKKFDNDGAIIYGGEPLYNIEKWKELFNFLSTKFDNIDTVSSLFFPESTFNELLNFYKNNKKCSICVSLDKPGLKRFHFNPEWGDKTHEIQLKRFKELFKIDPYGVAIRSTITEDDDWFQWVEKLENELKLLLPKNIAKDYKLAIFGDFEHSFNGNAQKILNSFDNYILRNNITKVEDIHIFFMLRGINSLAGGMKTCDVNMSRLAINNLGERIKCVNDFTPLDKEKLNNEQLFDIIYNTEDKICKDCLWKNLCFSRCFMVFNKSSCELYFGFLVRYLKMLSKSEEGIKRLIKLSVIKMENNNV